MNGRTIIFDIVIVSVLSLIAYIYYPFLMLYSPLQSKSVHSPFSIEIPKIDAYAPIIANVDPLDKFAYEQALTKGVAQAKGSADFGDKGTIYLFAHAALYPWEITRVNTAFLRLGELNTKDEIIVTKFDETYNYKVKEKREIWPDEVSATISVTGDQLILQTTTPMGTDFKRLLIIAVLDEKKV